MNKFFILIIIVFLFIGIFSYEAGELPFTYLNVSFSPIGNALSLCSAAYIYGNNDINNPASASLNNEYKTMYFATSSYIAKTYMGYIEFNSQNIKTSVKYFNSGQMEMRDEFNNYIRDFYSSFIVGNANYGFSPMENLHIGFGILLGIEVIPEFQQYAMGVNAGVLYTGIKNMFDVGFYINNTGISYANEKSLLPMRIMSGIALNNPNLPIRLYIDIGKVLDSKYFYAFAGEWIIQKPIEDNYEINLDYTNNDADTLKDTAVLELFTKIYSDTLQMDTLQSIKGDSIAIKGDSIYEETLIKEHIADTIIKKDSLDIETKDQFISYEDYLKSLEKEEVKEEKNDVKNDIIEKTNKKNVFDKIGFSLRAGFSSDKAMLMTGASTDLSAGITAGFSIVYDKMSIDYGVKFWGELGISHSVGIGIGF